MGWKLGDEAGRERLGTDDLVSQALVKGKQLRGPRANDAQIHYSGTRTLREFLRGGNQLRSQAGALARRLHREESQIGTILADFDINASHQSAGILGQKKFAASHIRADSEIIDAIAAKNGLLNDKRSIDQSTERRDIFITGPTKLEGHARYAERAAAMTFTQNGL